MENKVTLYSRITELEKWEELFESCIDEETGEVIDSDVLDQLKTELMEQVKDKSSDIVKYSKNRETLIDQVSDEIKKLQSFKKSLTNRQENFKNYILFCMDKLGVDKIETPNGTIKITKSEGVVIVDKDKIPSQFVTIKQDFKEDLVAIKKAIKSGEEIEGAILEKRRNVKIG